MPLLINQQKYQFHHQMISEQNPIASKESINQSQQKIIVVKEEPQAIKNDKQPNQYQSFQEMLDDISQEVKTNQYLYSQFLDVQEIQIIIDQVSRRYRSHSQASQMITMIIDFLSYCINQRSCMPSLKTTFTSNYPEQLAQRWQKLRDPSYEFNKGHLRILNYIVDSPLNTQTEYDHCFQSLQFNMEINEARKVAEVVKKMCNYDIRAFSYLSNYFYNSCIKLQKANINIQQIKERYLIVLNQLLKENPAAPPIELTEKQHNVHPSFDYKEQFFTLIKDFEPKNNENQTDNQQRLQDFIMDRAEEAKKEHKKFDQIIHKICSDNDGFHFKSAVKVKNKEQTKAIIRIKQKMLGKFEELLKSHEIPQKDIDLQSSASQQYTEFLKKMKKILNRAKEPIAFKVSDLLRGKCVFTSVFKINKCCQDIKEQIKKREGEGLRVIEIDNRLSKNCSDIVMKILFGRTIAELQLVKDLDTAKYEFHHKLYQLQRSKFFTPLTQLFILNEDISKDYFNQVKAIILMNLGKGNKYNEKITFQDAQREFKQFSQKIKVKIASVQKHQNEIDVKEMRQQQRNLKQILKLQKKIQKGEKIQQEIGQRNRKIGIYLVSVKKYQKAKRHLMEAKNILMKKWQQNTRLKQQIKEQKEINNDQSKNTKGVGKENNIANTLIYIGQVNESQGDYALALENYFKCLEIQQRIKGKGSIDTATTLNNIGGVYESKGDYALALENYFKCLEIQQRIKGKGSIDTAITLNNIGGVYESKGDYALALENYFKCLEIQQRIKGKGSIDTAITLNNIGGVYESKGDYALALENYFKCLEIKERIKGKGSIDTASIICFFLQLFFYSCSFNSDYQQLLFIFSINFYLFTNYLFHYQTERTIRKLQYKLRLSSKNKS